jgi:hypothetical protein
MTETTGSILTDLKNKLSNWFKGAAEDIIAPNSDALLDKMVEINPKLSGSADLIRQDEGLKTAAFKLFKDDPEAFKGFQELTDNEASDEFYASLENTLSDSGNRKIFTDVLNKVADDPQIGSAQLIGFVNATVDVTKNKDQESLEKWRQAAINVGISEARTDEIIQKSQLDTIQEGLKDFLDNPSASFANIGDKLEEAFGNSGFSNFFGALGPMLQGLGEIVKNFFGDVKNSGYGKLFNNAADAINRVGGQNREYQSWNIEETKATVSYIPQQHFDKDFVETANKLEGTPADALASNDGSYNLNTLFTAFEDIDSYKATAETQVIRDAVSGKIADADTSYITNVFEKVADLGKASQVDFMGDLQKELYAGDTIEQAVRDSAMKAGLG